MTGTLHNRRNQQIIQRHLRWILPVTAFLLPVSLGVDNWYWWRMRAHYLKAGNSSCALARGYAREFENIKGRRPSMEELQHWAGEHFQADLQWMEIGYEGPQWIQPDDSDRRFKPASEKPGSAP